VVCVLMRVARLDPQATLSTSSPSRSHLGSTMCKAEHCKQVSPVVACGSGGAGGLHVERQIHTLNRVN
jgi:hypothetical protein